MHWRQVGMWSKTTLWRKSLAHIVVPGMFIVTVSESLFLYVLLSFEFMFWQIFILQIFFPALPLFVWRSLGACYSLLLWFCTEIITLWQQKLNVLHIFWLMAAAVWRTTLIIQQVLYVLAVVVVVVFFYYYFCVTVEIVVVLLGYMW